MVRSNSGDWKMIFRTNLSTLKIGLMMYGRARWQEAEATRKDFNTVLIRQDKKFFIFWLSKVIPDAIPLILLCRTMYWFRTISSSAFITSDVPSIYTPSQIPDWYREDKIQAGKDRRYSLQPWIPWIKVTEIRKSLIWPNHVLHFTNKVESAPGYGVLGRYTACSTERIEILWNKIERNHPLRYTSSLLYLESCCDGIWRSHTPESVCVTSIGFRSCWKQQTYPTNPTKTKNPIIKNGETRRWARVHQGDRERYHVWSRRRQALNKNGETRKWIRIHTKLRVDAYKNWRRRSNKNGETRHGGSKGGTQHWFQECQDCHTQLWRKQNISEFKSLYNGSEGHPHRAALHADLKQNDVYNPFSKDSKEMIRELGNVELFELCETTPKVQCSQCRLHWNQGIVYCICEQCLIYSESRRKFNKLKLDAVSIPDCVIKTGASHGARHGKTEVQR